MNSEQFAHKTNEALVEAHEQALNPGHARFTPIGIALCLVADPNGILRLGISNAGGEEAAKSFEQVLKQMVKEIPSHEVTARSLTKVVNRARSLQKSHGDTQLAVDHLILGLLKDSQIADALKEAGVSVARVKSEVKKLQGKEGRKIESASGDTNFQALKTYGRDLVEEAGKLDPVIGVDKEIQRIISILSKRRKNNPVLIGEPGVGKTAVVEGLAQRIVRGDIPSNLADVRLVALDMGLLIAGAKYRGEFEERDKER